MSDRVARHPDEGEGTSAAKAELYRRFGARVFALSPAEQWLGHPEKGRPLSDAEIARELGLTKEEATDLRCMAESGLLDPAWFREADEFKKRRRP